MAHETHERHERGSHASVGPARRCESTLRAFGGNCARLCAAARESRLANKTCGATFDGTMAITQLEKARQFRALHAAGTFVIPNPFDGGSARVLERMGFKALAHCRVIVEATDLPVSGDLEKGFGDTPEAAAETIRLAAEIGLVGGSIEDATGDAARPLFEIEPAAERIAAAVAAARALAFPFTLTARAENFVRGKPDLEDTIRRLRAYEAAGADVLFAPGLPDLASVRAVCAAVTKPVNVIAGIPGKPFTVATLTEAGVRRISLGPSLHRAAMTACIDAAREVVESGAFTYGERAVASAALYARMGV